ncbi:hypothetical protein A2U01_0103068, partial [Trifolium medium]|nr:hypothetical protein [Trifolium medium]
AATESDGKPKFPRFSERKRQTAGNSENSWLERKKATSAMLARWQPRWASKP